MKVGMIGLGKLGLPVSVAMDYVGHSVMGYDVQDWRMSKNPQPNLETGPVMLGDFNQYLADSELQFGDVEKVCKFAEGNIIFVAVQTPHDEKFGGDRLLPEERKDFDYSYLKTAVEKLAKYVKKDTTIAIISTVLPGTIRREILPLCNEFMHVAYNAQFIAMGRTMYDYLHPEFTLIGTESELAGGKLEEFYQFAIAPVHKMSIESAELTKVAYNTFIGQKIIFVNTLMQISDHFGCNVDNVTDALKDATDRLISPAYMSAGMGDGGACHPRDNIAMSWLSDKIGLKYNIFDDIMRVREEQTKWLASLVDEFSLPIWVLGLTYKPGVALVDGSPAMLLFDILFTEKSGVRAYDPIMHSTRSDVLKNPGLFFIGTKHEEFQDYKFAEGSVVIDPWGYIPEQKGVLVIHVGR